MWIHAIGLIGGALVLAAYFLISEKQVSAQSVKVQVLNLVGALCIGAEVFSTGAWGVFVLEFLWVAITLRGIWRRRFS